MNTVHLEHFVAFVECDSRAAAAKRLYTSPQSISKSIYALEREFGVALVQKSGRSTVLTAVGRRFYEESVEVLEHIEHLRCFAAASQTPGPEKITIAMATAPFDNSHAIGERMEAQHASAPSTKLSFLFGPSGSCLSAVEEGIADCAIVFGKVEKPGITCQRLFSFSPAVLMACTHPLAQRYELRLEDVLAFPIAAPTDMRHCRQIIENRFQERTGQTVSFRNIAQGQERSFFLHKNGLMFSANTEMLNGIPPYLSARNIAGEDSFSVSCFYAEKEAADKSIGAFVIPRLKRMAFLYKAEHERRAVRPSEESRHEAERPDSSC